MLHVGFAYLSWVTYVLSGMRSAGDHRQNHHAAQNLRDLLARAAIDPAIPAELTVLHQWAADSQPEIGDGPEAITWARNRLAHPKDPGEPYRLEGFLSEAWLLALHYAELLLLHELGYHGHFQPRFPTGQMAHTSIAVPWSGGPPVPSTGDPTAERAGS